MSLRYNVKENEPAGWPDSISFEDFKGVSYAKVEEATQIIESLIRYHAKVDPATYFESRRETNAMKMMLLLILVKTKLKCLDIRS